MQFLGSLVLWLLVVVLIGFGALGYGAASSAARRVEPEEMRWPNRSILAGLVLAAALLFWPTSSSAATYNATPATYATVMANMQSGDVVRWADPAPVPEFYSRRQVTFSPPVEIDYGSAIVGPQRFTNIGGLIIRGGNFRRELRTTQTGLMFGTAARDIKVLGSRFYGGRNGITIAFGRDIYLENIECDSMGSDCVDASNVVNFEANGLHCYGDALIPSAHPDCFQTWARFGEQPPTNLLFTNVHCEGIIQCVADFVHIDAKARPLGPDPFPVGVRIKGLRARTHAGHAIAFGGCLGDCWAEDVLVMGDEKSTFVPHVTIPKLINSRIAARADRTLLAPWVPSAERYPRGGAVGLPAVPAAPVAPSLKPGTSVLVGTSLSKAGTVIVLDGGTKLAGWAEALPLAVTVGGQPYTVVAVDVARKRLTFSAPVSVKAAQWHAKIVVR